MPTRDDLHQLVDAIPDDRLAAAAAALEPLADPVTHALLAAPEDDEPLTEGERSLIAKSRAISKRKGFIAHDEIKRRLSL